MVKSIGTFLIVSLLLSGITYFFGMKVIETREFKPEQISEEIIEKKEIAVSEYLLEAAKQPKVEVVEIKPQVAGIDSEKVLSAEESLMKFGVVVSDYSNENGVLSDLEGLVGRDMDIVSVFYSFGGGNDFVDENKLQFIKDSNKTLMMSWEPWKPDELNEQVLDYLAEIPTGNLDSYINQFAGQVKVYEGDVVMRFAHEMNGNWYPWGNRPEEYKNAYIYLYERFSELQVDNVTWLWGVNTESVPYQETAYISQFYPGDEYVDIIGIDGFNFGNEQWRSFDGIFNKSYSYVTNNYEKPVWIAEVASSELGGNKAEWVNEMFGDLSSKYEKVDALIWFNLLKEKDWRMESSESSFESFVSNL